MSTRLPNATAAGGFRWLGLAGILALAVGLRLWGPLSAPLPWHPDEYSYVFWPLDFFSGDLNPHFFTYPTAHYYLLAGVYACSFFLQKLAGAGASLEQWVAYHYFWDPGALLDRARWVGVVFSVGTVAGCAPPD